MSDHCDDKLINRLAQAAPCLKAAVDDLIAAWLSPLLGAAKLSTHERRFNDPIWGTITLYPWEVAILDTPLFQRLRGIKQTGLAYLVFPGSTHDRFSHICGVIEAAQRMMDSLNSNIIARRRIDRCRRLPCVIADEDRYLIRFAALMHDVGHGPFSHAIEPVLKHHHIEEFEAIEQVVTASFPNVAAVSVSESIALLLVASPPFLALLAHPMMNGWTRGRSSRSLANRLIMAIVGASDETEIGCLALIINSQLDADKLDYIPRDAHYSGLPLRIDADRLLSHLQFNITESGPSARCLHAIETTGRREPSHSIEIGVGLDGQDAVEELKGARISLYDRFCNHYKVRAADAMAQRLVHYALRPGERLELSTLYGSLSDETLIRAFGGLLDLRDEISRRPLKFPYTHRSHYLAKSIIERKLYQRAFTITGEYFASSGSCLQSLERAEVNAAQDYAKTIHLDADQRRALDRANRDLADMSGRLAAEHEIAALARSLSSHFDDNHAFFKQGRGVECHHVIVDLPLSPYPVAVEKRSRSVNGCTSATDLHQSSPLAARNHLRRLAIYVFSAPDVLDLIALAARVWFLRKYKVALAGLRDRIPASDSVIDALSISELLPEEKLSSDDRYDFVEPSRTYDETRGLVSSERFSCP
jgi:HD superfamily phosphohydrolase